VTLSVVIITLNEEAVLVRTLEAAQTVSSEIIVVDSGSGDRTVEIAESFGAIVYFEKWRGYSEQKNFAFSKAKGNWILSLDADEVLTETAINSIKQLLARSSDVHGYFINRRSFYMGKLLKYAWQPDFKLRLVCSTANPRWVGGNVHEELIVDGHTGRLHGEIIHYSYKSFFEHMQATVRYAQLAARSHYNKGVRSGFLSVLFKPFVAFLKKLILQRGLLDGVPGVIASVSGAVYTYMKYSFLWEMQRDGKNVKLDDL
jgi:glycosyltransferase involved in cell wall biosynthesis